jgi:serine/threonine protein kinase
MVMDYIEGPTLADYIRSTSHRGHFPSASDIVSIFTAVSLALDYAHQKGMIHRDIKPANIMLDKRNANDKPMGEPILMDFGIAKLQGSSVDTTRVLGTPLYVSPEQAQGLSGDKRSDLYSLGIILYEMMTGITPFRSESVPGLLMQHFKDTPTPPALINPAISPKLSAVILKSIAKDPDARFANASAMTIALAEALNVPVPPELWKNRMGANLTPTMPMTMPSRSTPTATPLGSIRPATNEQTPTIISSNPGPAVYKPQSMKNGLLPSPVSYQAPSPIPQPPGKRPKKRLYMALIALIVVVGLGLASYALFALKTPPGNMVVGQVHFRSSQNKVGDFDVVEIASLTGIPDDTPDGKNYSAWLEGRAEYFLANWSFTVHNGKIYPASQTSEQHENFLISDAAPYRFLITRQQGHPAVPPLTGNGRLYYALIPQTQPEVEKYRQTSDQTFDIMPCPKDNNSSNPCMS